MRHTREEVIKRTIQEFERLDRLVNNLTDEDWNRLLPRPETKDPWTVKDALALMTIGTRRVFGHLVSMASTRSRPSLACFVAFNISAPYASWINYRI